MKRFTPFSKLFLILTISVLLIICLWIGYLSGMVAAPHLMLVGVSVLQQTAALLSTLIGSATHNQSNSLAFYHLCKSFQSTQQQPASNTKSPDALALLQHSERAKIPTIAQQSPIVHQKTVSTSVHSNSKALNALVLSTAVNDQQKLVDTVKQISLEQARKAAVAALGNDTIRARVAQTERLMSQQSRLGLLNFQGTVVAAGESANGRLTCYVGFKDRDMREIRADNETAKWLLKRQIEEILAHDADYRNYVFKQYQDSLRHFITTNDTSVIKRVRARLMLPRLVFEGNNWEEFYLAVHDIQPYYFSRKGALRHVGRTNRVQPLVENLTNRVAKNWPQLAGTIRPEELQRIAKNQVDSPWGSWFLPDLEQMSKRILHNPENILLLKMLDACESGDLMAAQLLCQQAAAANMKHAAPLAREMLLELRGVLCDDVGIYKHVAADPLYEKLTIQEKQRLKNSISEVDAMNQALLTRHAVVTQLAQAWIGTAECSPTVQRALYALIDRDALATVPALIDAVIDLTADAPRHDKQELLQVFFLPNGVLKDFAQYPRLKTVRTADTILSDSQCSLRRILNKVLYLEHASPQTIEGSCARAIIQLFGTMAQALPETHSAYEALIAQSYHALLNKKSVHSVVPDYLSALSADKTNPKYAQLMHEFFMPNGAPRSGFEHEWLASIPAATDLRTPEADITRNSLLGMLQALRVLKDPQIKVKVMNTCTKLIRLAGKDPDECWQQAAVWRVNIDLIEQLSAAERRTLYYSTNYDPRLLCRAVGKQLVTLVNEKNYDSSALYAEPLIEDFTTWAYDWEIATRDTLRSFQDAIAASGGSSNSVVGFPMPSPPPEDPHEQKSATEEFLEILESSTELKDLCDKVRRLNERLDDTKVKLKGEGNITLAEFDKLELQAHRAYEEISNMTHDVAKIAQNTGISEKMVQQIKQHLFVEGHLRRGIIQKFSPDINISDAWFRLLNNTFIKSDLVMLQHECAESLIMRGTAVSYEQAHPLVNGIYYWAGHFLS